MYMYILYIHYILINGPAMVKMMQVRPYVDTILFAHTTGCYITSNDLSTLAFGISLSHRSRDWCTTTSSIQLRNFELRRERRLQCFMTADAAASSAAVGRRRCRANGRRHGLGAKCGGTSVRPASCLNSVCTPVDFHREKANSARRAPSGSPLTLREAASFPLPRSGWKANDTDLSKMETPLARQTLCCDNCYLITAGGGKATVLLSLPPHSPPSFIHILCQHFGKANISVTTLFIL